MGEICEAPSRVDQLTSVSRLQRLAIILTNRCNLRCVYCTEGMHAEDYFVDASPEHMERVLGILREYAIPEVWLGFYGETTLYEGWTGYCEQILALGCEVLAIFNFARMLTDEEVSVISRLNTIHISIDTFDRATLKELRKSVDVQTVLYNLQAVRSYCVEHGLRIPNVVFLAVMSTRVVRDMKRLVALAAVNGVRSVEFQSIVRYSSLDPAYRNVIDLEQDEFLEACRCIEEAITLASLYNVKCVVHGIEHIRHKLEWLRKGVTPGFTTVPVTGFSGYPYEAQSLDPQPVGPGHTRYCLVPWTESIVDQSGNVFACCQLGAVMGQVTANTSLAEILNNEQYRSFRTSLLTGDGLGPGCRYCRMKEIVPVNVLETRVESLPH